MPKVSRDYLEAQRADILEGARRCFAGHGYEEATVVRLEEATGRSRGAIFHHFPTKLDLFLAVLEQDAEREAARWETGSVADALTGLAAEDPDWATVVVEQSRRRRTDPTFRDRWAHRTTLVRNALRTLVHHERGAGNITATIPDEVAARFISVVGDGLLLQRAILGEVPHTPEVIALATAALSGGDPGPSQGREPSQGRVPSQGSEPHQGLEPSQGPERSQGPDPDPGHAAPPPGGVGPPGGGA
jgi:TetR/AcrR family transcriptional regulator, transcriptional repressor of aconitase